MNTINGDGEIKVQQSVSRQITFVLLGAALILLVPLVAMQFTNEVAWSVFDFVVAGVLLVGTGLIYVVSARTVRNAQYRYVLGAVLAVALVVVWVELAVGLFGTRFAGT